MLNPKIAIVIITHNSEKYLHLTLESIFRSTRFPHKIVIIESESTDKTPEICDKYATIYPHIEVHHTKKEGPMRAINYALEQTKGYDVLLTHDDVIFHRVFPRDWLGEMYYNATAETCGYVIPINGGGVSGSDYLEGFPWAGTWCTYISRKVLDKVGFLDLNFEPGMGDDIDLCYRIHKEGLKGHYVNYEVTHHRLGEKPQDDDENLKKKNARYFRMKHKLGEFK